MLEVQDTSSLRGLPWRQEGPHFWVKVEDVTRFLDGFVTFDDLRMRLRTAEQIAEEQQRITMARAAQNWNMPLASLQRLP